MPQRESRRNTGAPLSGAALPAPARRWYDPGMTRLSGATTGNSHPLQGMKAESLYVHFPFCETKCHYCDFYSLAADRTRPVDRDGFARALETEIRLAGPGLNASLETVFLGGGTPSMTEPEVIARALAPLWNHTSLKSSTEWTMEANPSSVDRDRLKRYQSLGVNRISLGVQATQDHLLKALGRVHGRREALRAIEAVLTAGYDNLSVDLLCGVPGQTLKDLRESLETLTSFPISHLSCYLLTLPPKHRMYKDLPDEDTQLEHLLFVDRWLRERGFQHYEISNFSRPGRRARHNLRYWTGKAYLGLGPSAHSFNPNTALRWKNVSSLHRYAGALDEGRLPVEWTEELSADQRQLEQWMLSLRLDEGFPRRWLDTDLRRNRAEDLVQSGLLENHPDKPDYFRLTPRGFALSDQVIQTLS